MKFGMFISAQQPRSEDPVIRFRQCVEQTRMARDVGFDAIAAAIITCRRPINRCKVCRC